VLLFLLAVSIAHCTGTCPIMTNNMRTRPGRSVAEAVEALLEE
jgi:hypothetical protein